MGSCVGELVSVLCDRCQEAYFLGQKQRQGSSQMATVFEETTCMSQLVILETPLSFPFIYSLYVYKGKTSWPLF